MTDPTPITPPVDAGNPHLRPTSAGLMLAMTQQPDGRKLGIVTIRNTSTTLTLFLDKDTLEAWGTDISRLAEELGSSLVTPPRPRLVIPGQ